jgi:hypothetical protein
VQPVTFTFAYTTLIFLASDSKLGLPYPEKRQQVLDSGMSNQRFYQSRKSQKTTDKYPGTERFRTFIPSVRRV